MNLERKKGVKIDKKKSIVIVKRCNKDNKNKERKRWR
jgi:hypothetical protein